MIPIRCPKCNSKYLRARNSDKKIIKDGFFRRSSDRKSVQRYYCKSCDQHFSAATFSDCYNQKKRQFNSKVSRQLSSVVSLRECARILKINRKTVIRKFKFMGEKAKIELENFNSKKPLAKEVLFDDMETFEHTKCKPISIGLMVEEGTRRILGYNVAKMPAKGLLAKLSVKKYGKRIDERPKKRAELFNKMKLLISEKAVIKSDECPYYFKYIIRHFPKAIHQTFKGRASAVVGQGELKKVGFDPLFSLNHTCATLRARVSRLIRKTWNTTKKPERLDLHLAIVCLHHNKNLKCYLPSPSRRLRGQFSQIPP
jgi:transposase-like protein